MNLEERERDACLLLHEVLCAIRVLTGGGQLSDEARSEVYFLADAAHNIPLALALAGEGSYRAILDEEVASVKEVQRRRDFRSPPT
jgi:hypothetical protein